jgi:hypothetical protein
MVGRNNDLGERGQHICIRIFVHDNIVGTWSVNKITDELLVDEKPWLFASNGFMKPTYQMRAYGSI